MFKVQDQFDLGSNSSFIANCPPNFTNLETIQILPIKKRFRGNSDLYSSDPRHMFFLEDNEVTWIDTTSPEFRELVRNFFNLKEDFIICNPTSCELGIKTASMVTHQTVSRNRLKEILNQKESENEI